MNQRRNTWISLAIQIEIRMKGRFVRVEQSLGQSSKRKCHKRRETWREFKFSKRDEKCVSASERGIPGLRGTKTGLRRNGAKPSNIKGCRKKALASEDTHWEEDVPLQRLSHLRRCAVSFERKKQSGLLHLGSVCVSLEAHSSGWNTSGPPCKLKKRQLQNQIERMTAPKCGRLEEGGRIESSTKEVNGCWRRRDSRNPG